MKFYKFVVYFLRPFLWLFWQWRCEGKENLPDEAGGVLVSNHLKWWDPLMLSCCMPKQTVHYLAKKELYKNPVLRFIMLKLGTISVDRHRADISSVKKCLAVVQEGGMLGLFPEGTRNNKKEMLPFEEGAAFFALKCEKPVYPVHIQVGRTRGTKRVAIGRGIDITAISPDKPRTERLKDITAVLRGEIERLGRGDAQRGVLQDGN